MSGLARTLVGGGSAIPVKFNFHFCFKCIISSEALAITLLSSQCPSFCFGGLLLLEATLVPYSVIGKDINYVQGQDNYCGLGGDFRNPGIIP